LLPWLVLLRSRARLVGSVSVKVTWCGILFICGMVLWCADNLKPGLSLDQLQ